jgi:hypothetical protein
MPLTPRRRHALFPRVLCHAVLCCAFGLLSSVLLSCSDDINIVAVLKAMGAESDQEVVQLVGPDEQLAALLMPSIQVQGTAVAVVLTGCCLLTGASSLLLM